MTKAELILDKQKYQPGEIVSGIFRLIHGDGWFDKPVDVKISLWAFGTENTSIGESTYVTVPATTDTNQDGVVNSDDTTQQEKVVYHYEANEFWRKRIDLPLDSLGTPSSNGYVKIETKTREVPFEFVLDDSNSNLLESYNGINASVTYGVSCIVDKKPLLAIDVHETEYFKVIDSQKTVPDPSSIYERAENEHIKLELFAERNKFLVGDTIRGKITLDNPSRVNIKSVEIGLRGIEKATADNLHTEKIDYNNKVQISGNWNSGDSRTFEFDIPNNAKRNYLGTFSKYSWEIAAVATMSSNLGSNLYLTHPVQII